MNTGGLYIYTLNGTNYTLATTTVAIAITFSFNIIIEKISNNSYNLITMTSTPQYLLQYFKFNGTAAVFVHQI